MSDGAAAKAQMVPAVFSVDGPGRQMKYARGQCIFRQGDVSDGIYFISSGRVRLSVASVTGRQATIAFLARNEVFGEQCLSRTQHNRLMSAYAASETEVVKIGLEPVRALLATDLQFANCVLQCLVTRMAQYEKALVHQLINNTERRLARALLHLSQYEPGKSEATLIEDVSQEMLSELVGASRPRVNGFMTKFRRLGHIEYSGNRIVVKPTLVSVLFEAPPRPRSG